MSQSTLMSPVRLSTVLNGDPRIHTQVPAAHYFITLPSEASSSHANQRSRIWQYGESMLESAQGSLDIANDVRSDVEML